MESLSLCISSSPCIRAQKSTPTSTRPSSLNFPIPSPIKLPYQIPHPKTPPNFHPSFPLALSLFLSSPLSTLAAELPLPSAAEQSSEKISLESVLVAVDDFNNRNPFFVAGVTFIWLVVIPFVQFYFRKYKYMSAIDSFRRLRDDPTAQMLDIRDGKSLKVLSSPNLKILNKSVVQVEFSEGEEDGFVKRVLERFTDPQNTVLFILDNFDGNSFKAAELLFKNGGFKEAYAIRGGVAGKKGWQDIQKDLLPPSVHITRKKAKKYQKEVNGAATQLSEESAGVSTPKSDA